MSDDPPPSDEHPTRPLPTPAGSGERGRSPVVLVAAVIGGLLLAGGVGAAVATAAGGGQPRATVAPDDPPPGSDDPAGPSPGVDLSPVDELVAAIDAARAVAEGVPVGIEERAPGVWLVELQDSSGREAEVVVDGSGARVTEQGDDGTDDEGLDGAALTPDVVAAIVDAAAGDTAGRVVLIETDGDGDTDRFEVEVRTPDDRVVELELDASYVITDRDEDAPGDRGTGNGTDKGDKDKGKGNKDRGDKSNRSNGNGHQNGHGHRDD